MDRAKNWQMKQSSGQPGMSESHKQALAVGREQGRIVRTYLEAIETHRPKRGRKRTSETIRKQLAEVENKLRGANALTRLLLVQERLDLQKELEGKATVVDLTDIETEFVKVAADYGNRKGISYAAWREAGVDAAVLKQAGISRGA
jgi:hypothetical protein